MAEFKGSTGIKRIEIGYTDNAGNSSTAEAVFLDMFAQYQEEVVGEILTNLVNGSPEETGTMKANWAVKPGKEPGSHYLQNTGNFRDWEAQLTKELIKLYGYKRPFHYYTIYNNSDYISFVDAGLGNNARHQGFIDRALVKTKGKLG